jgi:hypothetical protein
MDADRPSGCRHVHPGMLRCIRVHGEAVQVRKAVIAVLSSEQFTVNGPTGWHRQHVFMRRTIEIAKLRLTSYAKHRRIY